ncbi:4Fe-4S ferredoxin [bacterium]|nr:4Fe-4S ferredoxin [bacterium]
MNNDIRKKGYLHYRDIGESRFPAEELIKEKALPVIECIERIPCNPCETSCPKGAIVVGENINDLPVCNYSLCSSCGICITRCPGLAIFMVKLTEKGSAVISIPWEIYPLPEKGDRFEGLDRLGNKICEGEITSIRKINHKTHIVSGEVSAEFYKEVRHFKIKNK